MITSTANRQVVGLAKLRKRALREDRRRFLVEGAQPCAEALAAGAVETLYHTADAGRHPVVVAASGAGVSVVSVSDQVMTHLTSTVTPQGLLAVARFIDVPLEEVPADAALVPVLCAVRDPGNAGTVLRSADAAGADAVVFAGTSVDVYNPKTVRASAGSLFHLPVVRGAGVEEAVRLLRGRGMRVVAAAADGEESVYDLDLTAPTAVLFGNEAWGIPDEARDLADASVRVPIHGAAESLNLAAAAALVMFESRRQRIAGAPADGGLAAAISASAHDVRSSLTALKGFASMLATRWDRLPEDFRRQIVVGMTVDAEKTAILVKMLVDAARLETGGLNPSPEPTRLEDAAGWVASVFARSDDHPDVEVRGAAAATIDPDRLQGLLLTLTDAVATLGGQGPVRISISEEPEEASVVIGRDGIEVDEGWAERATDPPRSGAGGGTLGVWLAARLAEAQGCSLHAQADPSAPLRLAIPRR